MDLRTYLEGLGIPAQVEYNGSSALVRVSRLGAADLPRLIMVMPKVSAGLPRAGLRAVEFRVEGRRVSVGIRAARRFSVSYTVGTEVERGGFRFLFSAETRDHPDLEAVRVRRAVAVRAGPRWVRFRVDVIPRERARTEFTLDRERSSRPVSLKVLFRNAPIALDAALAAAMEPEGQRIPQGRKVPRVRCEDLGRRGLFRTPLISRATFSCLGP